MGIKEEWLDLPDGIDTPQQLFKQDLDPGKILGRDERAFITYVQNTVLIPIAGAAITLPLRPSPVPARPRWGRDLIDKRN
jgi:hypothetical protein